MEKINYPIYEMENKIHVSNHQPVYIYIYGGESKCLVGFMVDIYIYIWLVGKNGDKKWEFLGSFMGFTGIYHNMVSMV